MQNPREKASTTGGKHRKKRQMILTPKDNASVDSEASTLLYVPHPPPQPTQDGLNATLLGAASPQDNNSNASSSDSEGEDLPLMPDVPVCNERWRKEEVDALMDAVNANRPALKFHFSGPGGGREIRRQAWRDVALYVCQEAKTHRTVRQCVDKTSTFSQKQKAKYNKLRREINKTGSGPPPKNMKLSSTQAKALEYLRPETVMGAFLIPYFFCLICGGVPIFILEISLGQFMRSGGYGIWNISPLWQGIGVATTVIACLCNCYYIIILAWDMSYLSNAFQAVLPWSHCDNPWNTPRCRVSFNSNCTDVNVTDVGSDVAPTVMAGCTPLLSNITPVDPVVEFWENKILQISPGVDQPDGIVWQLALSLAIAWTLCYFCIWKGVKWTGKVVYFTAVFPYIVLTILLVRGLTLPGARDGVLYYIKPDFTKLLEVQIWIDAGTQIFFSYAIALGALAALGSYNKFHNNCYRDCIFIACVNSCTSLYAGIVIFAVLGFMAQEQGVSIDQVAESGPGLAFIAYPKAVTQMPIPALWAVLFFVMIIFLGLDTQFVTVEAVITVVVDTFPRLRKGWNREIFIAVYCLVSFLIGLSMVTRGGMYVFQLFDFYSASGMALLWCCFFECAAVAWTYGIRNYYEDISLMIGYTINPWLKICWTVLTPIVTGTIFIASWVCFSPLTYNRTYHYPAWAQGLGMCLAFASMSWIPIVFIYRVVRTPGSLQERLRKLATPILPDIVIKERELLRSGKPLLMDNI